MEAPETRYVVLVGLSPTSRNWVADEEEPGTEIWGLNHAHAVFSPQIVNQFTRWFQIHPWEEMAARQETHHKHLEWLAEATIPIYLSERRPEVPSSLRYPREEVLASLGMTGLDYLTSSVSYMLALAIHEGFNKIKILGIDLSTKKEYIDERPNFEFLLGIAHARGVEILVPDVSPILKGAPYAKPGGISFDRLRDLHQHATQERDRTMAEYNFWIGQQRILELQMREAHSGQLETPSVNKATPVKSEIPEFGEDGIQAAVRKDGVVAI